MLTAAQLLDELRRLRDDGTTTNAALARLLSLPSPRIAEIFEGKRRITIDEMKVLVEEFGLSGGVGGTPPAIADDTDDDTVEIQHISLAWGLGASFTDDPVDVEMLRFPRQWIQTITHSPAELLTWARARGDSMRPTIEDGDVVLLDRSQTDVRERDALWAFTTGDVASIKRLRVKGDRFQIFSDNPSVPPDEEPMDFVRIVARVVFVGRRI